MSTLPIEEGNVRCPREGREIDSERCALCERLVAVAAGGNALTCAEPPRDRAWFRAAIALFNSA